MNKIQTMNLEKYLTLTPEVQTAINNGDSVVALESTIISHGMPYPANVETALSVEAEVVNTVRCQRPLVS